MKLKFDTTSDVKRSLTYVANRVLAGELDAKTANCIAYLSNAALSAIRAGETEIETERARDKQEAIKRVLGE